MERKEIGILGEKYAQEYLKKRGYGILDANYRVGRLGEIDLIAYVHDGIAFIEVKTRTGYIYGTPAEAISSKKQKTIRQVAACFLKAKGKEDMPVRFDVLEVLVTRDGRLLNINHLQGVF